MKSLYLLVLLFAFSSLANANENVNRAILFLEMACVTGGEKLTVELDADASLTLKKWQDNGVEASVKVNKEEVKGLVGGINNLSAKNAQDTRDCMKPYIGQIMKALFPPEKNEPSTAILPNNKAQASKESATSSSSSASGTCGAYAGPNGANSTCANIDGRGVTTGVDKNSAQGKAANAN